MDVSNFNYESERDWQTTDIGDNNLMNTITQDEVLDMVRDNLWNEVADSTAANYKVAQQWGLTLVAYEVWEVRGRQNNTNGQQREGRV